MSLGHQLRSFGLLAARFRQELFEPVSIDYDGGSFPGLTGYHTPIQEGQKSEEIGKWAVYDGIVRIIKADFPTFVPELEKSVVLTKADRTQIPLRIASIRGFHVASAEWILACLAEN